ncbi:MAG: hemolysin family protein [Hyphomicrobium sp.]|uniref:hemolysin family protein n=1 Tax=Hyphomicrobium sp. TaxID=82 RepID=UPI003D097B49
MSSITFQILIAIFLLVANAFYVAAEFALVKSRGFRVKAMIERQEIGARLVRDIMNNIEPYLACCQLGITMASLGLGWVGEPVVSALLQPLLAPLGLPETVLHFTSFMTGFLVFSSLHIVLGEQVPKTLAIRQPEPVSRWIAYPLHVSYRLFYPLNWLLNGASRAILTALGVQETSQHEVLTGAEIEGLVGESAEHGKIASGEAEYIQNVFRFGEMQVADIMVHRTKMETYDAAEEPQEIIEQVLRSQYTRVPIWKDEPENIVGLLNTKDLLGALAASHWDVSKLDIMSIAAKPWFVPDTTTLKDQLSEFLKRKAQLALVVDEYGEVQGLVTLEDILEEIVGQITDEHDNAELHIRPQADGTINVDGTVPVRDLNRHMDWDLPEDEATTIAGLVVHEAQMIPEPGQVFTFYGYRLEILRRSRNKIAAVRIKRLAGEAAAGVGDT